MNFLSYSVAFPVEQGRDDGMTGRDGRSLIEYADMEHLRLRVAGQVHHSGLGHAQGIKGPAVA